MNKTRAKQLAESGTITVGQLREYIAKARSVMTPGAASIVNASVSLRQALDIYEAALAGRHADALMPVFVRDPYSRAGKMRPHGDSLITRNILRDCAP